MNYENMEMRKFEVYFCSTNCGEKPEDWEQKIIVEAENRQEAIRSFMKKIGIKNVNVLDYIDMKEVI